MKKFKSNKTVKAAKITAIGVASGTTIEIHADDNVHLMPAMAVINSRVRVGDYIVFTDGRVEVVAAEIFEADFDPVVEVVKKAPAKPADKKEE